MSPVAFKGWPAEAFDFFEALTADNTRSFWQAHKGEYEAHVRAPMVALLDELEPEFGTGKIFRPNRDVRFSKDKSPYKTNIAATFDKGGYVSLALDGLGAGSGYYMLASDQLAKYRAAVADDATGAEVEGIVGRLRGEGREVTAHESLKTAPKGIPKDHPRIELLRMKGLVAWQQWPVAAWMGTAKAKDRVVGLLRAARPLCEWLDANVGPSALAEGWGR